MATETPQMIGKYKVVNTIAKGGMGVVYKAIHPSLKRYVVIKKMLNKGNKVDKERFLKEAEILLKLQNPYIVHLYDYFTEATFRYMVEEFVDGMSLDKLIEKQIILPPQIAMLILHDVCSALKYAHSRKIVHRDIKPANILISNRGEVKLADFGIASDSSEKEDKGLTMTKSTLGTVAYMSPEQFEDSSSCDNRADIYSLGVMLYEMLTGTKPFPSEFSLETLAIKKKGRYIRPRKIDKTIPKEIAMLIHRMIRPKAKNRIQTVEGVLRSVKRYLKHYNQHNIRVHLAKAVVEKTDYSFPKFIPKDVLRRRIIRISIAVLLFVMFVYICWKQGLIHRTLLRKIYTPVKVEVLVPKSISNYLDLPIRAFFFENDGDKIPEIEDARRTFSVKGSRTFDNIFSPESSVQSERLASVNKTYDIPYVYLTQGEYRVKVVAGPYIWWNTFTVGKESVVIDCDVLKNSSRKLTINASVFDSITEEEITDNCSIKVLYNNKWVNLFSVPSEELLTGKVWKIKIDCESYEPEVFSLAIDWYQDKLYISSKLKPAKYKK